MLLRTRLYIALTLIYKEEGRTIPRYARWAQACYMAEDIRRIRRKERRIRSR